MKLRHFLLPIAATVFVIIVGAWFWLLHTESGVRWILGAAKESAAMALDARSIDGDLSGGVLLRGVVFDMNGVSASAASIDVTIDLDIFPLSLEVKTLHIDSPQIELLPGDNAGDTDPASIRDVLENLALPIRVRIADLQISDTTLVGLIADRPVEISELRLVGVWNDEIQIEQFHIATEDGIIDAVASVELRQPFNLNMTSQLRLSPQVTGLTATVDADVSATGNLELATVAVDTRGIEGHLRGTIHDLLNLPSWDITVDVPTYEQSLNADQNLRIENLALASQGNINTYSVNATLTADATGVEPLSIRMAGSGSLEAVDLSSLEIDGANIAMSATSGVRWAEPRRVSANIQLDRFRPTALIGSWPAAEQISGTLSLLLTENHLLIDSAALKLIGTETEISLDADIDLTSNVVEGELDWNHVQWPVAAVTPQYSSEHGSALLSGTLDDWKIRGRAAIEAVDVAGGQFVVDGGGDRESLALQIEQSEVFGGGVQGSIEYSWVDNQQLAGELALTNISIGSLLPDWPGVVSGGIAIDGQLRPLRLHAALAKIEGNLRGEPLVANGEIIYGSGELAAGALSVNHGRSTALLDGSLYAATGLTYSVQLDNLGDYLNDFYGSIDASGRVSLAPVSTYLHIDASSDEVGYREYRARGIRISDLGSDAHLVKTTINISELSIPNRDLSNVNLQASISPEEQALTIAATADNVQFNAGIRGVLADWARPTQSTWTGVLDALRIEVTDEGEIFLIEPAALHLSQQSSGIERFCVGHALETHFCAEGSWAAAGEVGTRIELTDIPVALVNLVTDTGIVFDQLVSGTFNWSSAPGQGATGGADIRTTPGTLRENGGLGIAVNTGPGMFTFDIREGALRGGSLELPMPGTGNVSGNFAVLDISRGTQSEVNGSLDIEIDDLSISATLSRLIDQASGRLTATFALQGTVADPVLTGKFGVVDGEISYTPLGLVLKDMQIGGDLHADASIALAGHFQSGDGRAEISTRTDYRQTTATGLELALRGENLTLIDVPDIRAVADTDLRINFDGEALTLGGTVLIGHASIRPQNLTASRVSESSDVVIVAGILPGENGSQAKSDSVRILGDLEVALGDDVVIDLDVAKAKVTGAAKFVWSGPPVPIGNGRYDLTGTVQAYGQVLEITEGNIQFAGVPADNPLVRLRAEREIFGNSQIKRAGILIEGSAKRQTVSPYTYPLTTEERALTLLVTGSDFDYEQGVGAVDFGTYIAPKLFLSYGIGLFDNGNIISARYDLVKGFGVKATSGEKSSGVDLIYRIDR